jgi:DNA-binding IclR family transcriptional regulator
MENTAVRSVSRAIRILELLAGDGRLSAADVSRRLGLPRSSAFELLSTLEQEGLLEKDRERNLYHLGLKLFELGARAQTNLEIRRVALPFLKALNQELDETVHLAVLDDREVLYVECVESTKRLRTYSLLGVRAHLHCTAVGKAILAFLAPEEVEEVLREKGLLRFTDHTLTDLEALRADLEAIRGRGYAVDLMEHEEGFCCVGAPVRDHEGRVFTSVSVSGPFQRITPERIPQIARLVLRCTGEVSWKLGWREGRVGS